MSLTGAQTAPGPLASQPVDTTVWSDASSSAVRQAIQRFLRNKLATVGLVVATIFVLTAVFAPFIARTPYDYSVLGDALQFPSKQYVLGTDAVGRDFFSRLVYGARTSMLVGFAVPSIALLIGNPGSPVPDGQDHAVLRAVLSGISSSFLTQTRRAPPTVGLGSSTSRKPAAFPTGTPPVIECVSTKNSRRPSAARNDSMPGRTTCRLSRSAHA